MSEGTNVGNIYLDLTVRNTVNEQIQKIAEQSQQIARKAFSGMEKVAEDAVNKVTAQTGKAAQKTTETAVQAVQKTTTSIAKASQTAAAPLGKAFSKPVELAKAKLRQLEAEFSRLSIQTEDVMRKDSSFQIFGHVSDGNKEFKRLEGQLDKLYRRMEVARDRLNIEVQAAAQKQAEAEEKAAKRASVAAEKSALKQQQAAQRAAEKAAAAAVRSAAQRKREEQKAAVAAERAAQRAAAAEEKAANRRRSILAAFWKNMLANAGNSTRKISGKITGLIRRFTSADKTTRRFASRLREIATGALFFNGISRALRSMTQYMGEALSASTEMKQALANLKGAAANAASLLVQALSPALVSMANAAAVALTYVERLLTHITGKTSAAAETAAKQAEKTAKKAQRYLAGFDQLNVMDSKDTEENDEEEIKPNYSFKGFNSFLESILAAVKAGQWSQVGALIAEKLNASMAAVPWDSVLQKTKRWTQNFVDTLNGFIHKVDFGMIGVTLGQGLNTLLTVIDTFFQGIKWKEFGEGFAKGLNNLIITVDWPMLGRVLTDKLKALLELLYGFVTTFDFKSFGTSLGQLLNAAFDNIDWSQLWENIKLCLAGLWEGICAFFAELEPDTLGAVIGLLLIGALKAGFNLLLPVLKDTLAKKIVETLPGVFSTWLTTLKTWATGTLLPKVTGWISGKLVPAVMGAFAKIGAVTGLSAGWVAVIAAAVAAVLALIILNGDKIKEALNKLGQWLTNIFCRDWTELFGHVLGGAMNVFVDSAASLLRGLKEIFFGLIDVLTGIFTLNWEKFWGGLGSIVKGAINGVIGVINSMISAVTDAVNVLFKLLSFKINLPNGGKIGLSLPQVTAPQIPYLADGGVIKQPTLAMVGEYAGASSNPEIVAPQSLIAETVASVMNDMLQKTQMSLVEIASVLRQILNAVVSVSSSGIRISIGGREVFQVVVDENNRAVLRTGSSPLKG